MNEIKKPTYYTAYAFPDYDLLKLNIDAGGVQSRRVIERIIKAETAVQMTPKDAPLQTISF